MSRSSKSPPNNAAPPRRTRLSGFLRLFFLSLLLISVTATVGSVFMRRHVIRRVKNLAVTSSSLVLSRPFPILRGTPFTGTRVVERLDRLGYRRVEGAPERPGQYMIGPQQALIYLRHARVSPTTEQLEQAVKVQWEQNGEIYQITEADKGRELQAAWLEPEILSLLGTSGTRAQISKALPDFSPLLVNAILAVEDERFYVHFGIDPVAILRAAITNFSAGRIVQGGSTITQQLAKNLFLTPERSVLRKIQEAAAAVFIETAFTKQQILELYMNNVFLGQEGKVAIHGFGEAARSFFDKDAADLTLAEAATLAGMVKAPTWYSPRRNPDRALERRNLVLEQMERGGYITAEQRAKALQEKPAAKPAQRNRRIAPYFVDYVRQQVSTILENMDTEENALHVLTGLDPEFQHCANNAVRSGLKKLEAANPRLARGPSPVQAALVALYPGTGEIAAWVGGRDYGRNQFDRVSMAKRQPGSAFKPFVYLTALADELNTYRVARTTSTLVDEPLVLDVPGSGRWEPKNYDEEYRGEVTLRQALAGSLNIPTVSLAMKVGIENVARTAELFGFGSSLPRVPSLALGAGEVTPLELARAYAAVANGGVLIDLRPILAILQPNARRPLFSSRFAEQRAVSEQAAFVLTDLLTSVIDHGTGQVVRRLGFKGQAAGKTGTTNDAKDAWFAGFTPRLLAVVWVGFDDNRPLKLTGAQAAAPIWAEFMKCTAPMEPELKFIPPAGIIYRRVDLESGLLDDGYCPPDQVATEVFIEGTEPVTACNRHGPSLLPDLFGSRDDRSRDLPPANERPQQTRPPGGRKGFWDTLFDWR